MLKFGRFKASLNFYNGKKGKSKDESVVSITGGTYRSNRDEFGGFSSYSEPPKRTTPSLMPSAKTGPPTAPIRQVKSTSDLIREKNLPPNLTQENPGVSEDPRGAQSTNDIRYKPPEIVKEKKLDAQRIVEKQRLEEQKKIEKQRIEEQKKQQKRLQEEQKKQQKLAAQEQAKQEKLRKEREKKEAQLAKNNKKVKGAAPQRPLANPLSQNAQAPSPVATTSNIPIPPPPPPQYSTNTLESSISRSSGPPPYNDVPVGESRGNVSYSKPVDTGSWDMISKHREQMTSRPVNAAPVRPARQAKQTVMDLNYKVDGSDSRENENSEA
ncbi:unnamed protein product [Chrysodeixis includens]|uniref:Uncharacterized protein n=1 Tax=Chrysodeixis includens TaxID=689277 RepID=A0A9P0C4D3_CHRIL|nr:unnamed protein product [Chrysodeixis includens]